MSKSPKNVYTNANFARDIGRILRVANTAVMSLTEGMWNPDYCAAPADMYARSVIDDLEHQIKHIKKRLKG